MKTLVIVICVLWGLWVGYGFVKKEQNTTVTSPSAEFNLAPGEVMDLQVRAQNGDCQAAYQLGRYHSNFTLKSEEAIHWFRQAVKCPETNPKLELIALLMGDQDSPHKMEIEKLIQEINKTDPSAAKRADEAVRSAGPKH